MLNLRLKDKKSTTIEEVFTILKKLDKTYVPPISESVDLKAYAEKLFTYSDILLLMDGKEVVGIAAIYCNTSNDYAFISTIGISAKYQGKGHGLILLKGAARSAQDKGYKGIELEVFSKNEKGIRFYEKWDFHKVKENRKKNILGESSNWFLMRLDNYDKFTKG